MVINRTDKGFSTYLLDKAIIEEKRKREEYRLEMIDKVFNALNDLYREITFKEAYLFGSIVKPYRFTKDSDIDIAFAGLEDRYFFNAMSFLAREVSTNVDLIQLERHRLAEKIKEDGIRWTRKD